MSRQLAPLCNCLFPYVEKRQHTMHSVLAPGIVHLAEMAYDNNPFDTHPSLLQQMW